MSNPTPKKCICGPLRKNGPHHSNCPVWVKPDAPTTETLEEGLATILLTHGYNLKSYRNPETGEPWGYEILNLAQAHTAQALRDYTRKLKDGLPMTTFGENPIKTIDQALQAYLEGEK